MKWNPGLRLGNHGPSNLKVSQVAVHQNISQGSRGHQRLLSVQKVALNYCGSSLEVSQVAVHQSPKAKQKTSYVAVNKVGLTGHCASEYQKTVGVRGCFVFRRLP